MPPSASDFKKVQAASVKARNERFRQRNLSLLTEAGMTLLSGDPFRKEEVIKVRCPEGHTAESKTDYFIKAIQKKTASLGCIECRDQKHSDRAREKFLKELEAEGYELLEPYVDAKTKLKIRRKSDGATNYITRNLWTEGKRWLKPESKLLTPKDMQDFLDARKPGYRIVDASQYRSKYDLVTVECAGENDKKERHTYTTQWQVIQYYDCRQCAGAFQSKEEVQFRNKVEEILGKKCHSQYPLLGTRGSLDLCFVEEKIALEYCGLWFHSSHFKRPSDHLKKLLLANEKGFRLLTVFADEWKEKEAIVLSKIRSTFGHYDRKVYARHCSLRTLSKQECRGFFNENHLQGHTAYKTAFGLFFKEELIAAMTFGSFTRSAPSDKGVVVELKRLAFKKGCLVVGGSSKLFKAGEGWAKESGYKKIISFADLRWSEGGVYRVLGFQLKSKTIRPSKHYFKGHRRWNSQTLKLKPEERGLGKTESQLREEQGFRIIYDCGHQRWEKEI